PVPRVAVGFRTAAKMMAVHDALEPAALADTGDFHEGAGGEDRYGYGVTRLGRLFALRRSSDREALEHPRRGLKARLLGVTRERLGRARGLLPLEAELHLRPRHLHDGARACLDHRDGHV